MTKIDKPVSYIVAGPNGAGKTTFAMIYLPHWRNCREFLNADLIAAGLAPLAPETQNVTAGKMLIRRIAELTEKRQSFGFETTLAGKGWLRTIDRLKDNGFHVVLNFLWLPDPQMAISRVRNRVQQGGHFIPDETVKRRYANGLHNFFTHYQHCVDDWLLYNAASQQPALVAEHLAGNTQIHNESLYSEIIHSSMRPLASMTKEESSQLREDAQMAFAQLRLEVIKRARHTGTPVITWRNGQVCELTPDEAEQEFDSAQENKKS